MHVMRAEAEEALIKAEADWENDLFLHQTPIWQELYSPEAIEKDTEWITPDSGPEFKEMLDELRAMGVVS